MSKITDTVANFEKSKVGQQVFRFVRLVVVGVAAAYISHSALDTTTVVAIAEVAFRQVFPT